MERRIVGFLAGVAFAALACASGAPPPPPPTLGVEGAPAARLGDAPTARRLGTSGWVEATAAVVASDSEAPAEARARAVAEARRAAVELVAGVRVQSGLVTFDGVRDADASSLVQTLTASRADAMVLDEELLDARMAPLAGGGYRVAVRLRARVLDRSQARDPGFRIQVELDRERFLAGEEVELAVRSSRDSRIYVLGITEDGATVLLPNRYLRDTRADAGEWLRFPDADLQRRGVRLQAQVPPGRKAVTEALVVVALRGPHRLDDLLPVAGTAFRSSDATGAGHLLAELLTPLAELPADSWAFDQVVYEVLAR